MIQPVLGSGDAEQAGQWTRRTATGRRAQTSGTICGGCNLNFWGQREFQGMKNMNVGLWVLVIMHLCVGGAGGGRSGVH